jgi:hypothetical protein
MEQNSIFKWTPPQVNSEIDVLLDKENTTKNYANLHVIVPFESN